jgi:PAS domain S-box-containing protein
VLVVADAQLDQRFAQDRMIQKYGIQSIACIPALNRGELKAMLYLENRQMPEVFTLDRVEILQHLSSQFGVSVENALLFDSLSQKVKELRQSEERYRTLNENVPVGVFRSSNSGQVISINPAASKMFGVDAEEDMPSYQVADFYKDPEKRRGFLSQLKTEGKITDFEAEFRRKDGSSFWGAISATQVTDEDGNFNFIDGVVQDISERKHAEESLKLSYLKIEQLKNQLEAESAYLQDEIKLEHNFENIIGQSKALKYVLHRVEQVAPLDSPVLIMGETGTGKELMARALHRLGPHGKRALVKVNLNVA